MKERRHRPLRREICRYCGQELKAGMHWYGGLSLYTTLQYIDGVLCERSAFWTIPILTQPNSDPLAPVP